MNVNSQLGLHLPRQGFKVGGVGCLLLTIGVPLKYEALLLVAPYGECAGVLLNVEEEHHLPVFDEGRILVV